MKNLIPLILITVLLTGCATLPYRMNPQFINYFNQTKTITIMPIDIKIYKLTAGGVPEEIDEWENQAKTLICQAIKTRLETLPKIRIKTLTDYNLESNYKEFLGEQKALYRAISTSVIAHTYQQGNIFPNKLKNFDYTFGSELNRIYKFEFADSLLFVSGMRTFWAAGRTLLAAWGTLLGAFTGTVIIPGGVPDWITVALVDVKTGNILWFRYQGGIGDLRDQNVVTGLINYLFEDFIK